MNSAANETGNETGLTYDKILAYSMHPTGFVLSSVADETTVEICNQLCDDGRCIWDVETVDVPAVDVPESCKRVAMFDTWSARSFTRITIRFSK